MHTKHLFEVQRFFHSRNVALISQMLLCLLLPSLVTVFVKCNAQATCCRSSTKCLQMSSPRMSPSRARLKQHFKLASQAKLFGRITWRVSPSCSQTFGNQLQWLAETGRLQVSSCATLDLTQIVGNSPNPATQGAVSPITVTKQVRKQPCLQDTEVDQGRDEDSCLSQGGKL